MPSQWEALVGDLNQAELSPSSLAMQGHWLVSADRQNHWLGFLFKHLGKWGYRIGYEGSHMV